MFLHSFKYGIKTTLRDKNQMFWSFLFTVILGTLFFFAFGNIYEKEELRSDIDVVAYIEDEEVKGNVTNIIENIPAGEDGDKKLFKITYASTMDEAQEILDKNDFVGLFYSEGGKLKLIVKQNGVDESILSSVVGQYSQIVTLMKEVQNQPTDVQLAVLGEIMGEADANEEIFLTDAKPDGYTSYFYNLLAMGCLMTCVAGVTFTIKNQANLSALGARKSLGSTGGFAVTFGGLSAIWLLLSLANVLAFFYLVILGVEFGDKIPAAILGIFAGNLVGVSAGYFVGSIGKLSKGVKEAFGVMFSVFTGFLAGLMIMDVRMQIEISAPFINDINPAIWISDMFYSLVCYDTYDRYFKNIIVMLVFSLVCLIGGVIIGRRKRYASI